VSVRILARLRVPLKQGKEGGKPTIDDVVPGLRCTKQHSTGRKPSNPHATAFWIVLTDCIAIPVDPVDPEGCHGPNGAMADSTRASLEESFPLRST
jgi:hypothetical protein